MYTAYNSVIKMQGNTYCSHPSRCISFLLALVQVCKRGQEANLAVMGQGEDRKDRKAVRNGTESTETSGDSTCWNSSQAHSDLKQPWLVLLFMCQGFPVTDLALG